MNLPPRQKVLRQSVSGFLGHGFRLLIDGLRKQLYQDNSDVIMYNNLNKGAM